MLISLHLPKTAGSSFATSLTERFGNRLQKDYTDLPLHQTPYNRHKHALVQGTKNYFNNYENIECIHGHFLPLKYRFNKNNNSLKFVTWMREPAERLASQYFYMKRHYTPEKANTQPLLKRIIDEDWSLERFCLGPELQNTYAKFLWGFPIRKFNFIGLVEHYEDDLNYFSTAILGEKLKHHKDNVNPRAKPHSYFQDNLSLKQKILAFHSKDVELYENALMLRKNRQNTSL